MTSRAHALRQPTLPGREEEDSHCRPAEEAGCPLCYGTGMEVVPGKGARRCRCRERDARAKLFEAARIPRRYENCSLSSYRPAKGNASQLLALGYAHRLVSEYPAVDRGLLFAGPVGVGKTHLAAAILRELIGRKGVPCLFYELGALLREVQESYGTDSQASELCVLSPVYRAEVLVLDELGAVKTTDWVRDTTERIIGARYNERKLTIVTTNYLDLRTSSTCGTLEERVGPRLRSRLHEMCRTVIVDGEDYRRRFDAQAL